MKQVFASSGSDNCFRRHYVNAIQGIYSVRVENGFAHPCATRVFNTNEENTADGIFVVVPEVTT